MAPDENIRADQPVEDLIKSHPTLIGFLVHKGLPCVVCGEAFWGTLEELARSRGWSEEQVGALVREFNENH